MRSYYLSARLRFDALWLLISLIGRFRSYRIAIKPDTAISLDGWYTRQSISIGDVSSWPFLALAKAENAAGAESEAPRPAALPDL